MSTTNCFFFLSFQCFFCPTSSELSHFFETVTRRLVLGRTSPLFEVFASRPADEEAAIAASEMRIAEAGSVGEDDFAVI